MLTAAVALVALTVTPAMADDGSQAPAGGSAAQQSELQAQAEANDLSPEHRLDLSHVTGTKPSPDKGTIPLDVFVQTAYVVPADRRPGHPRR